ncbi:dihydrofolate reductase [bacterium]|nr:dihydrofolate reductase [bacterium]
MAQVVYYVAVSLDGFIATPGGGVEWLEPFQASGSDYGYDEFYAGVDALIMGSRTYEQTLTFGPSAYGGKRVLVLSARDLQPSPDVGIADLRPDAAIRYLVSAGASTIWLVGGGELAGSFAREGLVDRYILSVMPVMLGSGVPLLGKRGASGAFKLESIERFDDVVQCTYRRGDA